jgi:hypothetical protein
LGIWIEKCWVKLFKIYIHWSNVGKKFVPKHLNLIIVAPFIIWWKVWDFFFKFFYCNTWKRLKFVIITSNYVILCFTIPTLCCVMFLCLKF